MVALLIIGMVILIFLGRQTIGQIDQIRPSIQSFIGSNTGLEVNLGSLSGSGPNLFQLLILRPLSLSILSRIGF